MATFWVTFGNIWATLCLDIWSHWLQAEFLTGRASRRCPDVVPAGSPASRYHSEPRAREIIMNAEI